MDSLKLTQIQTDTSGIQIDSLIAPSSKTTKEQIASDKEVKNEEKIEAPKKPSKPGIRSIFVGKPGKAFALSLAIPGGGQMYNKRYWKAPIVWVAEGLTIYNIVNTRRQFSVFDRVWRYAIDNPNTNSFLIYGIEYSSAAQINTTRIQVRRNKEFAWLYWGLTHLVFSIEAFVDRHLIDFDMSDDLSVRLTPESTFGLLGQSTSLPCFAVTYHFP